MLRFICETNTSWTNAGAKMGVASGVSDLLKEFQKNNRAVGVA